MQLKIGRQYNRWGWIRAKYSVFKDDTGSMFFTLLIIKFDLANFLHIRSQCALKDRYSSKRIPRNM